MKTLALLLILAAFFDSGARATPLDDKIKAFTAAINEASRADPAALQAQRALAQIDLSTMAGGQAELQQSVRQMMAMSPSPEVKKAGEELLAELTVEQNARDEALAKKVDAVIAHAADVVARSRKPEDLDSVLSDLLAVNMNNTGGYDPNAQAQNARVNYAYQFVCSWQDFLAARNAKNNADALNKIQQLLNNRPEGAPIIPRSRLLVEESALTGKIPATNGIPDNTNQREIAIGSILAGVKKLDDLEGAIRKIQETPGQQTYDTAEVEQLASLYAQAKNGLPLSLNLAPLNYGAMAPNPGLARVESMTLLYLLPRFLGGGAPAPQANETVNAYLDRVTESADSTSNLELLQHTIMARMKIARSEATSPGTLIFLAGLTAEAAGQYGQALSSYRMCLTSPDESLPDKLVRERLDSIKKNHPSEYAEETNYRVRTTPDFDPRVFNPYTGRMPEQQPPLHPPSPGGPAPNPAPASAPSPSATNTPPTAPTTNATPAAVGRSTR